MKKITCVMLFVLSLSCTGSKAPFKPVVLGEGDEYAVYAAVLNRWFDDGTRVVVMTDSTADYMIDYPNSYLENLPGLKLQTIAAFNAANSEKAALHPFADVWLKCYLFNLHDITLFVDLNTRFPDAQAWVQISRVGFNADKTQALVYTSYHWMWRDGEGNMILLVKDNAWRIAAIFMVWVN